MAGWLRSRTRVVCLRPNEASSLTSQKPPANDWSPNRPRAGVQASCTRRISAALAQFQQRLGMIASPLTRLCLPSAHGSAFGAPENSEFRYECPEVHKPPQEMDFKKPCTIRSFECYIKRFYGAMLVRPLLSHTIPRVSAVCFPTTGSNRCHTLGKLGSTPSRSPKAGREVARSLKTRLKSPPSVFREAREDYAAFGSFKPCSYRTSSAKGPACDLDAGPMSSSS